MRKQPMLTTRGQRLGKITSVIVDEQGNVFADGLKCVLVASGDDEIVEAFDGECVGVERVDGVCPCDEGCVGNCALVDDDEGDLVAVAVDQDALGLAERAAPLVVMSLADALEARDS